MSSFLKRIGFILLVFITIALLISFASLWSLRQGDFYKPSFVEHYQSNSPFDYVIIGSSTGLTTLNTQVIDSSLGTRGLNLSMDDTALSSQYLMLQHFLQSGKQTQVCVLAASILDYDVVDYKLSGNDYRFLPYVSRDYVSDYYHSFSGSPANILSLSKWLPLFGVGYYNAEVFYPSILSLIDSNKRNRFDAFGNYSYPVIHQGSEVITARTLKPVGFNNHYVQRIQDLCDAYDIQLIVYIPPHKRWQVQTDSAPYQLINHSDLLGDIRYFYDAVHVNSLGRQTVSLAFAREFSIHSEMSP